jgi:IS5 family transposase
MLRIYFLQHWFNLSDPGAEDALYESPVLRGFAGIDLGRAAAPDETTILNFRHLLEKHALNGKILDTVNLYLASQGIRISTGTIVDATIISAPSSTKNEKKERDPEMHQTKKGHGGFKVQVQQHIIQTSKEMEDEAVEKMENKGHFPLSHGTATTIYLNLFTNLLHLEFESAHQYYFGAKAHIGVDSKEGVVHSVCTSAA